MHGHVHVVGHAEQREIALRDQAALRDVRAHPLLPLAPVAAAGRVDEDDRHDGALAGLDQRQRLEALVVRAEAAGKQRDRVRLLHEDHLAREEIPEVDQLVIAGDHLVRRLLERQPDVDAEGGLAAGAALRRGHDAAARARDHHPALARDALGEGEGLLPGGRVRRVRALPKTATLRRCS